MTEQELGIQIQRCVDGELDAARQSALLRTLEETAGRDGWRRLALAFIENQVLESALASPEERQHTPAPVARRIPIMEKGFRWPLVAAVWLCGIALGGFGTVALRPSGDAAVVTVSPGPSDKSPAPVYVLDSSLPTHDGAAQRSSDPVMNLMLVGLGGEDGEPISVPVYLPEQLADQPQQKDFSSIGAWQTYLESQGYAVDRHREYLRVPLDDGRQIIVPSESVRVKYAVQ